MAQAAPTSPRSGAEPDRDSARRRLAQDDARRSFLRMVSHELRTPLNSILGFSEILASELYGPLGAPQYKEYADIIRTSGARLLKLVNQVLEIARLEGGAMDLDLRQESLDHALDDVLDNLKDEFALRGVSVVIEGQGQLPNVRADARALRSVLTNLLQNAVTFSPDRGIVRVRAVAKGHHVAVSIIDQGAGVDPHEIPRLLRPFEQGENALTRHSEGAGLGLPIVELLCTAMGGRLRLISSPGEGMTAQVRLPAA
ncbi:MULTISPECIES: sensor histidine kinase [Phenylobacterium]|uniref:histidine kinase n=1 Tax=Phenylobacterium koreense TaxID=266125 RepID=A0ABV2EEK4_9CAUL